METNASIAAPGVLEICLQTALHELALDVMVVDGQARLLYANRSARSELESGLTLQLRNGRVCTALVAHGERLSKALQAARTGRRSMFELGSAGTSRMHAVIPLPPATASAGGLALVLSGVRQPYGAVTLTLFAKAAGLTASERDVLISLCSGLAAQDIALQRAVRISTVRTQISSIREKVGARTVTQVIRKVSCLPPMSFA
jgi:DNA-binding CsgD family transcriptional regulator